MIKLEKLDMDGHNYYIPVLRKTGRMHDAGPSRPTGSDGTQAAPSLIATWRRRRLRLRVVGRAGEAGGGFVRCALPERIWPGDHDEVACSGRVEGLDFDAAGCCCHGAARGLEAPSR